MKDEDEQNMVGLATKCSTIVMQEYVQDQLLSIIDDERKVTHSQLSEKIENAVSEAISQSDTSKRAKLSSAIKFPSSISPEYVEMCYPPIIQSGGTYSLKPSAVSDDSYLHFGTILCSVGLRYHSYCSNISRTFLIAPSKQQEGDYLFLLDLQKSVLGAIRPGVQLAAVYQAAVSFVRSSRPDLEKHLLGNLGFSTGLEFRESDYVLSAKSEREILRDMTLNLVVGFLNIERESSDEDPRSRVYSLLVSDMVFVGDECRVISECPKQLEDVSYFFKTDSSQVEKEHVSAGPARAIKTRSRTGASKADEAGLKKRNDHQRDLLKRIVRESLVKYAHEGESQHSGSRTSSHGVSFRSIECYKKEAALPREVRNLQIFVDKKNECILLPICGMAVPFHISTLKNVSKSEEGEFSYLRINFQMPVARDRESESGPQQAEPFMKAISFRSADTFHVSSVFREINELKKSIVVKEAEKKDRADLVAQEALEEIKGGVGVPKRVLRLPDVYMRPVFDGKRVPGDLEVHSNGIRYRSMLKPDQKVDILFSNMKHFFFQPCDSEMVILLHVHLNNPIMVGKKKTKDIQFYREALEAIVDETGSRGGRRRPQYGDEDEIMQEQEERKRRAALNLEFKAFCERMAGSGGVSVDIPLRELGFYGVPFRQNVFLMPTRDCLVHLTDPPYLIVSLAEVEVASLERVLFGLKNFDLVFVFRDHSIPPQHVDTIPISFLEPIRNWLDASDVYTMQSNINFNWTNVMKTVNEDPVGFYEMGGWEIIQATPDGRPNEEEEDSSDEQTDDSVYEDEAEESVESDEYEEEEDSEEEEGEESEYSDESDFDEESEEESEEEPSGRKARK